MTFVPSARTWWLLIAVALAASSCTASSRGDGRHVPSSAPETSGADILQSRIDLGSGESFDAAPAHARPPLTATAAWVVYAKQGHARINRRHIPAGTTAELGVFNGGGYSRLAYAYFTPHSTPAYSGPTVPSPPPLCTAWTMLDARTGEPLESSWFDCAPS